MTIELDPSQVAAKVMMARRRFAITTGGPGTGKTTILREALSECERNGDRIVLCAPTGKAAKRMEEATGRPASTVHRALGYYIGNDGLPGWKFNRFNPLPFGAVFVDEASMLDVHLFARLLDAIEPKATRLVLIGDANQLPSVGPGKVFGDLVEMTSTIPVSRLTQVHRSAAGSWICANSPKILAGDEIPLEERDDFRFVETFDPADIAAECSRVASELDCQVLIPQRTGVAGTEAVNVAMQEALNPERGDETEWFSNTSNILRPRDRVIQTRNNYDLGVFNGEVGEVTHVDSKVLSVSFPDRSGDVHYTKADAFDLQLAYALTIHKSQGSEWPWVAVVIHSTHSFMLTRRLIYTAVTRGKKGVILIGDPKGIERAVASNKDAKRNTSLSARVRKLRDSA